MRKNLVTILLALVVSVLVHLVWPHSASMPASTTAQQESALERIKRTGVIRCGYVPWPPFFEVDPNTKAVTGFFKDVSDAVLSLSGWKVDYIQVPSGGEVQDQVTGRIDAMCGTGPWYLNSLKEVNFTQPLAYAAAYLFARADEARFNRPEDLNRLGISFVSIDGDVSFDLTQRFYPLATLQALPGTADAAQAMLNVTTHKVDAIITDPVSVAHFNANNADKLKSLFPNRPVAVYGMEFSVKKGETELLETLNGYSAMALNMNLIDPILKKYDPDGTLFLPVVKPYHTP